MKRKKIIAGNWKMNLSHTEAINLISAIIKEAESSVHSEIILFPGFLYLADVKRLVADKVGIGAQNCSQFENGVYTGEVSAEQLKQLGIGYVLIGHSERREHFGESNSILAAKLKIAFKYELKPVFCCGEPLKVREKNEHQAYVLKQLEESLFQFSEQEISNLIVAYEPIWAIGTGRTATSAQAQEMHHFIRNELNKKYSVNLADKLRILYGGSCTPTNSGELFACPDVDGALIGKASLNAPDFLSIIRSASL